MAEAQLAEAVVDKPVGMWHSIRRIRRIAHHVGARSYLEIGVNRGRTFNRVDFERKVAVDPQFRFDVEAHRSEGVEFHAMTSDLYFTQHGRLQKFDVVFLDGLHTFQQTLRDFCNSLSCAHDRTVWLIDDVLPVDVYSAWPNPAEAVRYRKQAGGNGAAWHGDVYKVMCAIHDFFPMYSYVTLTGADNPQALVWKSPRAKFSPVFDRMEAIERLTYFDLLKRMEILNVKSEDEGFQIFSASVSEQRACDDNARRVARRWMRWRGKK
jgi:hypothetical protein